MSRNNIDDIFRDGLKNYDSEIDPNEIWNGIQEKQPSHKSDSEDDDRKPFAWWWMLGLVLLVAVGSATSYFSNDVTELNNSNTDVSTSSMGILPTASARQGDQADVETKTVQDNQNTLQDQAEVSLDSKDNKNEGVSNAQKSNANTTNSAKRTNRASKAPKNNITRTNRNASNSTSQPANVKQNTTNTSSSNSTSLINTDQAAVTTKLSAQNNDRSFATIDNNTTTSTTANTKNTSIDFLDHALFTSVASIGNENEEEAIPDVSVANVPEGCYGQPAFSFAVGAHLSPDLIFHKITSTDEAQFPYINERKNTEKLLESFHAGLDVYLQHRSGLILRSGVEYAQINKRFNFEKTWTSPTDSLTTYTREKKTTNRYRMVDIPLTVGYDIEIPNWDLSIFIEAGVSMNVMFSKKGDILNPIDSIGSGIGPGFEPITFTDGAADRLDSYVDNVGLSFLGGIGLKYELQDGLFLYAQPAGKIYLNSFTKKDYPISEKFSRIGLNMGIIYRL